MTSDIDIISAALHGDKKTVLRAELALVRDEIAQRLRINDDQRHALLEELHGVRNRILQLEPDPNLTSQGDGMRNWLGQTKEQIELQKTLLQEQKDCWNDIQHLRDVERNLLVQLAFLDQRDERLRDLDAS